MALYMIERTFADDLDLSSEDVELIDEVNADEGVHWLSSFLSADRRRTYCLYEAPSPDAIIAAARLANVPVDAVVEVGPATLELSGRLRDWAGTRSPPRTSGRSAPIGAWRIGDPSDGQYTPDTVHAAALRAVSLGRAVAEAVRLRGMNPDRSGGFATAVVTRATNLVAPVRHRMERWAPSEPSRPSRG